MDILIDFDGTCVTHNYPKIGYNIGAVPVLKALVEEGHNLILFTMRSDSQASKDTFGTFNGLQEAVDWFKTYDIPLYGIQTNPTQSKWTTSPKAYGQLILDDIGLGIPLMKTPEISDRPFVDWENVARLLSLNNYLSAEAYGKCIIILQDWFYNHAFLIDSLESYNKYVSKLCKND